MLGIRDMFRLWRLIGKHLPDENPDDDIINYVGNMINNMMKAGQPTNFADAILLMSGKDIQEISKMESNELIGLFVNGFADNMVLEFKNFITNIGFNDG